MKLPKFKYGIFRTMCEEIIFPQKCAHCQNAFSRAQSFKQRIIDAYYGLCSLCRSDFTVPPAERGRCSCCGQPLISESDTCLPCRNGKKKFFDRIVCLFPYTGKYQKVLTAYKFEKRLNLANYYCSVLLDGLNILAEYCSTDNAVLVPVPPRRGKIKKTGFDQIEYLSKKLEKTISIMPIKHCLKRLASESQKKLNRKDRLHNLQSKIILNNKGKELSKTVILFDDVYTTGATMDACAEALKTGGAENIYGICLLYD